MGQTERIYRIERLLRHRRFVPLRAFLDELEISKATFFRDLERLRSQYNATIEFDRDLGGYRFVHAERCELPGLWFSAAEIHALLTCHHLLESLEPGLLSPHIEPLKQRLQALLKSEDALSEIGRRIRILRQASRRSEPACFQVVAHALLARKRLRFQYHGRGRGDVTARKVSPQRLVHYRDNWYLDAWDHGKRALRTFAADRVRTPRLLDERAKDVPEDRLDSYYAESYGIFSGRPRRKARLRFAATRARWIADEAWHPQQKAWFDGDRYCLEIPYSDDRELVLDILRFGPEVEVLAPKSLRNKVSALLRQAADVYRAARAGLARRD